MVQRLVVAGDGAEGDAKAVPTVDRHDGERQPRQLGVGEPHCSLRRLLCFVARRAFIGQPRVAAERLPWVPMSEKWGNPNGVLDVKRRVTQPFQG